MKTKRAGLQLYLLLASLFVAALVACNLIANKFITVDLGFKEFVISAGVLPYPITFLITDVLSEIYGKRKTSLVVLGGLLASLFVLLILWAGGSFPAITGSPVGDDLYSTVFSNSWRVIAASMLAYTAAQFIDVRVFHFWKKLTKGKHLWLRNNASTIFSQFIDTTLVVVVLFYGAKSTGEMGALVWDGWLFKMLMALLDTPIAYLLLYFIRKRLRLGFGQEFKLI